MSSMEDENDFDNDCDNEEDLMDESSDVDQPSAEEIDSDHTSTQSDSCIDDLEILEKDQTYNIILADIEKQFQILRKLYIEEKNYEVDLKMIQVMEETSPEFDNQLKDLIEQGKIRMDIAEMTRQYRIKNAKLFLEAEQIAAHQNHNNEIKLLYDSIEGDIKEKIRKLNEERDKANSELFSETHFVKKSRKDSYSDDYHNNNNNNNNDKRRKAVVTEYPYIIHRLREEEIREDVKFIKCCLRSLKNNYQNSTVNSTVK